MAKQLTEEEKKKKRDEEARKKVRDAAAKKIKESREKALEFARKQARGEKEKAEKEKTELTTETIPLFDTVEREKERKRQRAIRDAKAAAAHKAKRARPAPPTDAALQAAAEADNIQTNLEQDIQFRADDAKKAAPPPRAAQSVSGQTPLQSVLERGTGRGATAAPTTPAQSALEAQRQEQSRVSFQKLPRERQEELDRREASGQAGLSATSPRRQPTATDEAIITAALQEFHQNFNNDLFSEPDMQKAIRFAKEHDAVDDQLRGGGLTPQQSIDAHRTIFRKELALQPDPNKEIKKTPIESFMSGNIQITPEGDMFIIDANGQFNKEQTSVAAQRDKIELENVKIQNKQIAGAEKELDKFDKDKLSAIRSLKLKPDLDDTKIAEGMKRINNVFSEAERQSLEIAIDDIRDPLPIDRGIDRQGLEEFAGSETRGFVEAEQPTSQDLVSGKPVRAERKISRIEELEGREAAMSQATQAAIITLVKAAKKARAADDFDEAIKLEQQARDLER